MIQHLLTTNAVSNIPFPGFDRQHATRRTRFFSGWRQAGQGRSASSILKQLSVFFLAATGFVVWAVQVGELALYYWFPERYDEMVKYELEDEKRREQFYDVDPLLPDELYFAELHAKDAALQQLSDRITRHTDVVTAVGSQGPDIAITFLNSLAINEAPGSGTWRPRFFLQGRTGNAIGEAEFKFERGSAEWVPVCVELRSVETTQGPVLEAALPLPHGLKYSNLNLKLSV